MALSIARPRPLSFVLPPFFLSFAIHFLTGASPRRAAPMRDPLCVSRRRFSRENGLYGSNATDPHTL